MRMARAESGEVFAMLVANPKVDSPIKLDLRLIEADQVMTPVLLRQEADLLAIDGIHLRPATATPSSTTC